MPISYEKLFDMMDSRGIKKYDLRKNGMHAAVVDKLVKDGTIDTTTIEKLCRLLECQPGDIMEYVKDPALTDGSIAAKIDKAKVTATIRNVENALNKPPAKKEDEVLEIGARVPRKSHEHDGR